MEIAKILLKLQDTGFQKYMDLPVNASLVQFFLPHTMLMAGMILHAILVLVKHSME